MSLQNSKKSVALWHSRHADAGKQVLGMTLSKQVDATGHDRIGRRKHRSREGA
jgi:hypothetical protein